MEMIVAATAPKINPMDRLRETIHENEALNQAAYKIQIIIERILHLHGQNL